MLAKLGFVALIVMVGVESSILVSAILWPLVVFLHAGVLLTDGAIAFAVLAGLAAAVWIGITAKRHHFDAPES